MRKKLLELDGLARRNPEYENKIQIMTEEIERLNKKLSEIVNQANRLDGDWAQRYSQLEVTVRDYELKSGKFL